MTHAEGAEAQRELLLRWGGARGTNRTQSQAEKGHEKAPKGTKRGQGGLARQRPFTGRQDGFKQGLMCGRNSDTSRGE
jgi:hypothetical protein